MLATSQQTVDEPPAKRASSNSRRNGVYKVARHPDGDRLMVTVRDYLDDDDVAFVDLALEVATQYHAGQTRDSGEPYIVHPIGATMELAKLKLPADVLAAGLLHDTVEDTPMTLEELQNLFGKSVARMVDGVTKLDELDLHIDEPRTSRHKRRHGDQKERRRIASLRKMFATAGEDFRVLLIKLTDKLNNLETLKFKKSEESRLRTARETIEIFAPLAERLGMFDIKWRMEDFAFQQLNPDAYDAMKQLVGRKRSAREVYAEHAVELLTDAVVDKAGINATITGRAKHLYSIHQKKQRYEAQGRSFDDIHDLIALRVIVDSKSDCYTALGIVHGLWPSLPGGYDDYISRPKMNGYQSIHTNVMGPQSSPLEVQIRSHEMHRFAEDGVAAHWAYKDGGPNDETTDAYVRTMARLKDFLGMQGTGDDPEEFVDSVREELLDIDLIQIRTPAGDIIELPYGATPLDFAYRIHTQVGHEASGAVVNGKLVAFNTKLKSGDVVRINRTRGKGPSVDWRDPRNEYLVTKSALAKVRQWFRKQNAIESLVSGAEQMKKVSENLKRLGYQCTPEQIAKGAGYDSVEALQNELGKSETVVSDVVGAMVEAIDRDQHRPLTAREEGEKAPQRPGAPADHGIVVMGQTDNKINTTKCCSVVYGDEIVGYITRSRGISAHHVNCHEIVNVSDPARIIELSWGHTSSRWPVGVRIVGSDRVGLLNEITGILKEENLNLHAMRTDEGSDPGTSIVSFTIYVNTANEIYKVFSRISRLKGISDVSRTTG